MSQKPLGLDRVDLLIHAGVTVAITTALLGTTHGSDEVVVALGGCGAVSLGVLAFRRWWALRKFRSEPVPQELVEHLEARLAELETVQTRMFEMEERLDFVERLLAQHRESDRLPEGRR